MSVFKEMEYKYRIKEVKKLINKAKLKNSAGNIKEIEKDIEEIEATIELMRKKEKEEQLVIRRMATISLNDDYCQTDYCTLKVIMMKKNGYYNATKLYKNYEKRFQDWTSLASSRELINVLSKNENITKDEILIKVMNGPNEFRGTYVHYNLMLNIVSNISVKHYYLMNEILYKAIPLELGEPEAAKTVKLIALMHIGNTRGNYTEKYKKIKNDKEKYISKRYTLTNIINMVNPILVISDLNLPLKDIRKILRTKLDKPCGIYMFFNNQTNEYYIGKSKSIIFRSSSYLTEGYTIKPSKYKNYIKDAMIKYTKSAFSLLILEMIDNYDHVSEREMYYINLLWPAYNSDLYIQLD